FRAPRLQKRLSQHTAEVIIRYSRAHRPKGTHTLKNCFDAGVEISLLYLDATEPDQTTAEPIRKSVLASKGNQRLGSLAHAAIVSQKMTVCGEYGLKDPGTCEEIYRLVEEVKKNSLVAERAVRITEYPKRPCCVRPAIDQRISIA